MANNYNLELIKCNELSDKEREHVDSFILEKHTNGEFINTLRFLEYHSADKFNDDSVIVRDAQSKSIRCVMLACSLPGKSDTLISHPGTTFAGPVINRKHSIENVNIYLDMILKYYESKYKVVELRLPSVLFGTQPFGTVEYVLFRRGYQNNIKALSNVINISNLQDEQGILKLFYSKRRNQVKKALKNDDFVFYEGDEIREEVWNSMNQNLRVKFDSQTTHSLDEIRYLKKKFPQNIKAYYVDVCNRYYGAFCLAFQFKNVFHTQYLDTNYEYTGQYPNLLLVEKLIEEAVHKGYKYFSFGASTENNGAYLNEGLYSYKADYGGGDIILPVFIKHL